VGHPTLYTEAGGALLPLSAALFEGGPCGSEECACVSHVAQTHLPALPLPPGGNG
jgi:hypothetical protein